jgi:DNA-binding GntR family transcriptional regulator
MKPQFDVALDPWQGIYAALRGQILGGSYEPGERLVESTLAEQFGTSRGPVRSALKELERVGLIVVVPRRGTFVRTFTAQDVDEMLTLWRLIWPFAVKLAVERRTPAGLARLKAIAETVPEEDPVRMLEFGAMFHRAVFEMAAHRRLLEIFDWLIAPATAQAMLLYVTAQVDVDYSETPAHAVYIAIANGDVDTAAKVSTAWTEQTAGDLLKRSRDGDIEKHDEHKGE